MIIVGLCGGSGSGKGSVCAIFERNGFPTIDTDAVYHKLTSTDTECLRDLVDEFGASIVKDGALDRRALAEIVFSKDPTGERLRTLNRIAHKHILDEARRIISEHSKNGIKMVVVDAPVLFESGFDRECDTTVAVLAERDNRIKRIMSRDNITYHEAARRIDAQHTDEWLREHADKTVENNSDLDSLDKAVTALINDILN